MARLPEPDLDPDVALQLGTRIAGARRPPRRRLLRAAAVVLLLGGGFLLGRLTTRGAGPIEPRNAAGEQFLLLIRGSAPERRAPEARLTAEYGAWARELADAGALVAAEKLADDEGRWIRGVEGENRLGGFFLIRASGYDEAERIARESPHVAYGGTIEVRAIDRP